MSINLPENITTFFNHQSPISAGMSAFLKKKKIYMTCLIR